MKNKFVQLASYVFCSLGAFVLPGYAALITYSDRPTFNASAPGLPTETFESGLVSAGNETRCDGPLSSANGSACFPANGLLPGVTYSATSGALVVLGAGFAGVATTSKTLSNDLFEDSLTLTFTNANAAGFDVLPGPFAGNILISAFSPSNTALGTYTLASPVNGVFFGLVSNSGPIGRITINSQAEISGELLDNLSFGLASVPEPSSLVLCSAVLLLIPLVRNARRR